MRLGDLFFSTFAHDPVGGDDLDIVHSQESEEELEPRAHEIDFTADRGASSCRGEVDLLAGQQSFGTIFSVAESRSCTGDEIRPGLDRRRNREIVDGNAEHDDIRLLQLLNQFIGNFRQLMLFGRPVGIRGQIGGEAIGIDIGKIVLREVAGDDRGILPLCQLVDELLTKAPRNRFIAADACRDVKNIAPLIWPFRPRRRGRVRCPRGRLW